MGLMDKNHQKPLLTIWPGCGTGLGMPPYCSERGKPLPLEGPTSRGGCMEFPLGSSAEDEEKEEDEEEEEEAGALEVARYGGGFPPFSRRCCLLPGPSESRDRVQTLPPLERPVRRLLFSRLPSSLIQNSSSVSPSSPGKCFIIARCIFYHQKRNNSAMSGTETSREEQLCNVRLSLFPQPNYLHKVSRRKTSVSI